MYTTGSRLAGRLDAQRPEPYRPVTVDGHEFMGVCHAHGVRPRITAQMIDAWGEAEWSRLTDGGWQGEPCATCGQRVARNGACACGAASRADRLRAAIFGEPVAVAEDGATGVTSTEADPEPKTARPIATADAPMPSSALLPDLPDDATPEQVAEWRARFKAMREAREAQLANTHAEYRSPYGWGSLA